MQEEEQKERQIDKVTQKRNQDHTALPTIKTSMSIGITQAAAICAAKAANIHYDSPPG